MHQNHNKIVFRSLCESDLPALGAVVRQTWELDKFTSSKASARMAQLYLRLLLLAQTYTCVAEQNGIAVGLIVVQDKRHLRLHLNWQRALLCDFIAVLRQGQMQKLMKMQAITQKADRIMYKRAGKRYEAELVFFIVDNHCRGLGVGKALYQRAVRYMRRRGVQNFYLYTDTLCNYGFYDAQGMRQNGRIDEEKFPYRNHAVSFFLYDKEL